MDLNVFLQSGGTRVAVHVGAVRAIEEAGGRVAAWAGVSAGSLVAAVRACGFSQHEAYDLMLHTDYRQFLDRRPLALITGFGLCAGTVFEYWLDEILGGRRFRDLGVPLAIVATDASTGEAIVFSNHTTPEEKVATAVRCSISIPGVFAVRRVGGRTCVDGCLTHAAPGHLFPDTGSSNAVVRMVGERRCRPQNGRLNLARYIRSIAEIVTNSIDSHRVADDWTYDLCINVGDSSGIDFKLGQAGKQQLYELSRRQCHQLLSDLWSASGAACDFRTRTDVEVPDRNGAREPTRTDRCSWSSLGILAAHT